MTLWEFVRACVRYWPVVLIGAVCTCVVGWALASDDGVYFTRTEIVFLAPTSSLYPNALQTQSEDIIDTAGVVARRVTGPGQVTKFASPDVTLVGLGVRQGWSLRLPDTGGQWATNFTSQRLILDIVDVTEVKVREKQGELIAAVQSELDSLQRGAGVNPVNDIVATPAPASTVIHHAGGSRPRALAGTAILGVALTATAVGALELRRRARLDRRADRRRDPRDGARTAPAAEASPAEASP